MVIDEIDRKLLQLEMERLSLSNEVAGGGAGVAADRLELLNQEYDALKERSELAMDAWEKERGRVQRIQGMKEQIDQIKSDIEIGER